MNRLSVLHVRSGSFLGSPEKLILGQLRELKSRVDSSVVLLKDGPEPGFAAACGREGVDPLILQASALSAAQRVADLVKQKKIDIVCTHDYKSNTVGWLASFHAGFKHVAVFHGRTSHDFKSRLYEAWDGFILGRAAAIVAVSQATKKQLSSYGEKVRVIPNAFTGWDDQPRRDLRAEWGIPAGHVVVGTAGRLSPEKRHDLLLDVMEEICREKTGVSVVIAGEGDERPRLEKIIRDRGLRNSVKLVGFVRDVKNFYEALDIFALPSDREGLPLVLLEAGAAGKPVVSTQVGGVSEVIENGKAGWIVPPNDRAALAGRLLTLINNKEERQRMGEEGRRNVSESFSVSGYARRFYGLYDSLFRESVVWISWEEHRRTREIAKSLDIGLFEVVTRTKGWKRYAELIGRTLNVLRRNKPAVVIIQCPSVVLAALMLLVRPFFRFRLISDLHNEAVQPFIHNTAFMRVLTRWIQRRSDLSIVTNEPLLRFVEKNHGKAFVLPDRIPEFPPVLAAFNPAGPKKVVFICTYAPDEPVAAVVESAKFLPDGVRLHITGNVKKADPQMVASAPANVHFTGFLDEESYIRELKEANVILDLTDMDDCLVCGAYESVALGKPLVTSDTEALRSYFSKGSLYTKHDSRSLGDSLNQALEEEDRLTSEMAGLKTQLEYSWDQRYQQLLSLIRAWQ